MQQTEHYIEPFFFKLIRQSLSKAEKYKHWLHNPKSVNSYNIETDRSENYEAVLKSTRFKPLSK